jgi:hypothetical protein
LPLALYLQHSIKKLLQQNIIRKSISAVLLLLFVLSITPKKFLHDIIADHVDITYSSDHHESGIHATGTGVACKCENLFAQPVFTVMDEPVFISAPLLFREFDLVVDDTFHSFHQFFFAQRGPPALV